ncbi:MAG: polyprenyl diphosphate synthase [archaeon]
MIPTDNKVPKHVGIILDGNRRFAKKLMLKPHKGHEWGTKKVEALIDWLGEFGIKELTLYCFSIQNFNRPKAEFNYLMELFRANFTKMLDDKRIEENKIRVNVIGRLTLFPDDIYEKMKSIMDKTKNYDSYILNLAMAYGGREEVIDAVKKIAEMVKSGKIAIDGINDDVFSKYMYLDHDPDLVIRTGGEKRTSNFLVWQSNYSEWIFLDKMWPEFEKEDFVACLNEYASRHRRYGK